MRISRSIAGPLTIDLRIRPSSMSRRAFNHYITTAHDAMPGLIGIRFMGQCPDHAAMLYRQVYEIETARFAAENDHCVA